MPKAAAPVAAISIRPATGTLAPALAALLEPAAPRPWLGKSRAAARVVPVIAAGVAALWPQLAEAATSASVGDPTWTGIGLAAAALGFGIIHFQGPFDSPLKEWQRSLEHGEASNFEDYLDRANKDLPPANMLRLARETMRGSFAPYSKPMLSDKPYKEKAQAFKARAWAFSKMFTTRGWGDRPHERMIFQEFARIIAAKEPLRLEQEHWKEHALDAEGKSHSQWAWVADGAGWALTVAAAKRPELAFEVVEIPAMLAARLEAQRASLEASVVFMEKAAGLLSKDAATRAKTLLDELVEETASSLLAVDALSSRQPELFSSPALLATITALAGDSNFGLAGKDIAAALARRLGAQPPAEPAISQPLLADGGPTPAALARFETAWHRLHDRADFVLTSEDFALLEEVIRRWPGHPSVRNALENIEFRRAVDNFSWILHPLKKDSARLFAAMEEVFPYLEAEKAWEARQEQERLEREKAAALEKSERERKEKEQAKEHEENVARAKAREAEENAQKIAKLSRALREARSRKQLVGLLNDLFGFCNSWSNLVHQHLSQAAYDKIRGLARWFPHYGFKVRRLARQILLKMPEPPRDAEFPSAQKHLQGLIILEARQSLASGRAHDPERLRRLSEYIHDLDGLLASQGRPGSAELILELVKVEIKQAGLDLDRNRWEQLQVWLKSYEESASGPAGLSQTAAAKAARIISTIPK